MTSPSPRDQFEFLAAVIAEEWGRPKPTPDEQAELVARVLTGDVGVAEAHWRDEQTIEARVGPRKTWMVIELGGGRVAVRPRDGQVAQLPPPPPRPLPGLPPLPPQP